MRPGEGVDFEVEAGAPVAPDASGAAEELDGDEAVEVGLFGEEDGAHPADAEDAEQFVAVELQRMVVAQRPADPRRINRVHQRFGREANSNRQPTTTTNPPPQPDPGSPTHTVRFVRCQKNGLCVA
jgi:hypothetical protein